MAVSAIAAAASTAGSWAAGTLIGGSLLKTFAVNFALSAVSKALAPKPPKLEKRDNTLNVRSPVAPRQIVYGTTRVGGTIVFVHSTGEDNKNLHLVIALASHKLHSLKKVYFNDELAYENGSFQGSYSGKAALTFHDGTQTTVDSGLKSAVGNNDIWSDDHILNGVAYLYVRLDYDPDVYSGIPNISAIVEGKELYDPRTGTTAFSNNPALAIYDYLRDEKFGMAADVDEIDVNSFNAAANLCEDLVLLADATQQEKYTLDGVVNTEDAPKDIMLSMLTSLEGKIVYSGGKFVIAGGEWTEPVTVLDEDSITGTISVQTKTSRRETFNAVKGVFSSEQDNYIVTDYPAVISPTYELIDGDPVYLDVELPYTTNQVRAQRIARLNLLKSRQQITATIPCNLSAMTLKAGDTVAVSNTRLGWSQKNFEVMGWKFAYNSDGTLGVEVSVRETAETLYDWNSSLENPYVAGVATNLPSPTTVVAPSNLSFSYGYDITNDGFGRAYVDVSWTANDVFAVMYEVSTDNVSVLTQSTSYRLYDLTVDTSYTIKVRAINRIGAKSAYVTSSATIVGDTTAPSAPTSVSASGGTNAITIQWTNPDDADLDVIQIWEAVSNVRSNASHIASIRGDMFTRSGLTDGVSRWYWLKAVDYSGNISGFNAVNGVSATTTTPLSEDDINGVDIVNQLPTDPSDLYDGHVVYLTTDGKMYIYNAASSSWITGVDVSDLSGQIPETKIEDGAITTDKIGANAIVASKLATTELITLSAQIKDAIITTAKIGNAAITSAKIGNAQVDTLQLAGNAVVIPAYATGSYSEFLSFERTMSTTSIDPQGQPVSFSISANVYVPDNDSTFAIKLYRGNSLLRQWNFSTSGNSEKWNNQALMFLDTNTTSGNRTYYIKGHVLNTTSGFVRYTANVNAIIMGIKR